MKKVHTRAWTPQSILETCHQSTLSIKTLFIESLHTSTQCPLLIIPPTTLLMSSYLCPLLRTPASVQLAPTLFWGLFPFISYGSCASSNSHYEVIHVTTTTLCLEYCVPKYSSPSFGFPILSATSSSIIPNHEGCDRDISCSAQHSPVVSFQPFCEFGVSLVVTAI